MSKKELKVYEFSIDDGTITYWIAATSVSQAFETYQQSTGLEDEEMCTDVSGSEIRLIAESELRQLKCGVVPCTTSVYDILTNHIADFGVTPALLATTEY